MATDLYIEIMRILNEDITKEQQAVKIKKLIEIEVVEKFQELIMDYERRCTTYEL